MHHAPLIAEPDRAALRLASAALDAAGQQHDAYALSQALAEVARCHAAVRDYAGAETCLQAALRCSRNIAGTDAVVDVLCDLSDTAERLAHEMDVLQAGSGHSARERARDHAFEAARLAGRASDPDWEIKVLLRISEVLDRCGDRDDAVSLQARAMRLMAGPAAEAVNPHVMPALGRLADC